MVNGNFFNIGRYCSVLLLFFCFGVIAHSFSPALTPLYPSLLLLLVTVVMGLRYSYCYIVVALLSGFLWANFVATQVYQHKLDDDLVKKDLVVSGKIIDVPTVKHRVARFLFEIDTLTFDGEAMASPRRVLLRSYDNFDAFQAGQCWRMQVRLKHPHSTQNPGVRANYEKYLFANRIRATGYVRTADLNQLYECHDWRFPVAKLRQHIWRFLQQHFSDDDELGILVALTLGIRSDINPQQYSVLRDTGTAHLMAISGLHVGIVSAIAMFLVGFFLRRLKAWKPQIPHHAMTVFSAVIAGLGYAVLAGMTIPTRRAFFMLLIVAVFVSLRRQKGVVEMLLLVLTLVLFIDPLAPLSIGFWLSFSAVALIIICLQHFSHSSDIAKPNWRQKLKATCAVQLCLSIGLTPIVLLFFGYFSVVSPLANFISIPIIGMLVVPIALFALLLFLLGLPVFSLWFFEIAISLIEFNWRILAWLADLDFASVQFHQVPSILLLLALVGFVGLLVSRAMPARLASIVYLLPAFLFLPSRPDYGDYNVTMLDVGQGLSMVVETKNHTLVYDTGPRYRSGFNAAEYVLLPFLQSRGIGRIDTLIISHEHNDHAGGYPFLQSAIKIDKTVSGVAEIFADATACQAGQNWQWDGVQFEILWPFADVASNFSSGNNASCVVRISNYNASVLLAGDIERPVERLLVNRYQKALDVDVLQVPHQGSKTSSTLPFIVHTSPSDALYSVGYANRYHHPHPSVRRRYRQQSVKQWRTDKTGAIIIKVGDKVNISVHRDNLIGYWYN